MDLIAATGPWMYPLMAVGACILGSTIHAAVIIRSLDGTAPPAGAPHASIIVWGVLAFVVGLLGTVVGFGRVVIGARAATGAELADMEAMMAVIWDGVLIIVTPVTLGLWMTTCALVLWLILQFWFGRRLR